MGRVRRVIKIVGPWRFAIATASSLALSLFSAWWFALALPSLGYPQSLYYPLVENNPDYGSVITSDSVIGWKSYRVSPGEDCLSLIVKLSSEIPSEEYQPKPPGSEFETVRRELDYLSQQISIYDPSACRLTVERFGWPLRAFEMRRFHAMRVSPPEIRSKAIGVFEIAPQTHSRVALEVPLLPIPLGLIGNLLAFLVLVYPIISIPAVYSGIHRRLTNRCTACGYSLDNLTADTCPECGDAITRASP